jgi:hypothetical protein
MTSTNKEAGEIPEVKASDTAETEEDVSAPHPLTALENHLNGSIHDAGSAVDAVEAFIKKEIAKLRAEFSRGKKAS